MLDIIIGKKEKIKSKLLNISMKIVLFLAFLLLVFQIFNGCLGTLAGIIVLVGIVYIFNKVDMSHRKFLIILIVISLIVRTLVVWKIHNPQMEFGLIYEICFHKIGFAKLFNVVISIFSILLMYRIMNRISDKKCAQIFTTLYAMFLNSIIYNCILSNQHIFLFLTLLAFDVIFEDKIIRKFFVRVSIAALILIISIVLFSKMEFMPVSLKLWIHKAHVFLNSFENELSLGYLKESGMNVFGISILYRVFYTFITYFDYIIWEIAVLFAIIGIFTFKNTKEKFLHAMLLVITFIVSLAIDIQVTYAFVFRPYIFILAAVGLKNVFCKIEEKRLFDKIKENKDKIKKILC